MELGDVFYQALFRPGRAASQWIDSKGKCRALTIDTDSGPMSVEISPTAPFFAKEGAQLHRLPPAQALAELTQRGFRVASQTIVDGRTTSLELVVDSTVPPIYYARVATKPGGPLDTTQVPPNQGFESSMIEAGPSSAREAFRANKKTARALCHAAKYLYALNGGSVDAGSFEVVPGLDLSPERIGRRFSPDHPLFREAGEKEVERRPMYRLLVPSAAAAERLLAYVGAARLTEGEALLATDPKIPAGIQTVADLANYPSTLAFSSAADLLAWRTYDQKLVQRSRVMYTVDLETPVLQFVQIPVTGARTVGVQNVQNQSLENAVKVSQLWAERRVNVGFWAETDARVLEMDAKIYTVSTGTVTEGGMYPVLEARDGEFSAVLALD